MVFLSPDDVARPARELVERPVFVVAYVPVLVLKQSATHHPTVALLFSGGIDSTVLLENLLAQGEHVQLLYVYQGHRWQEAEREAVARIWRDYATNRRMAPVVELDLPVTDLYPDHWSVTGEGPPDHATSDDAVHLPGRNLLLLGKAAVWCQLNAIDRLALAPLGTSPFSDAGARFITRYQELLTIGTERPLRLELPFATRTKGEIMLRGRDGTAPFDVFVSLSRPIASLRPMQQVR